jgi:hypothetical protein
MDFNQCFSILQMRASVGQNSAEDQSSQPGEKVAASVLAAADNLPASTTAMEMISCLHVLQAERIKVVIGGFAFGLLILCYDTSLGCVSQTYHYFDNELQEIIAGNYPARYPVVCTEVTGKFSKLSMSINTIKVILFAR